MIFILQNLKKKPIYKVVKKIENKSKFQLLDSEMHRHNGNNQ